MSLFYFLSLLLFLVSNSCRSLASNCLSNYTCGNINISYPFSLYDPDVADTSQTQYCGYPGLRIYCAYDTPIIYLGSDNYTITDINYDDHTLSLSDTDIYLNSTSCPKVQHNVSLNHGSTWLNYTNSDVNITFFFDCQPFPLTYSSRIITCLDGIQRKSYVFPPSAIDPAHYPNWVAMCHQVFVTPVLGEMLNPQSFNLSNEYGPIVKNGFQLEWNSKSSKNCGKCESDYKGQCGYNMTNDSFVETCFCANGKCGIKKRRFKRIIIGTTIGVSTFLALCMFSFLFLQRKKMKVRLIQINERNKTQNIEATLECCASLTSPKMYTFSEIRKMTKSFSEKLGQGGYGSVFKGKLNDGNFVAVKVFKDHGSDGEEFINEVASIARTSHVNIVRLLGFSIKGSNRALMYEFMPNGSLDKYLHERKNVKTGQVEFEKLFEITVGIARGLEYLHRGCNTRIVHFDIKPHNILLDSDYCPKISDFGLAKLCQPKESIISMSCMRGTIGYIAPEVFSRNFGSISSKSDVYSYGMMILEMLGEEQNKTSEIVVGCSETYFPDNIYKHLEENTISCLYGLSHANEETVRKIAIVGLWCIQLLPDARPSMSRVLDMLEGSVEDLSIPQKFHLSLPQALVTTSSSTELPSE